MPPRIGDNPRESQYSYDGPAGPEDAGQVEGGELPPGIAGPRIRDALATAEQEDRSTKPPGVDKPGIPPPIPTQKDVRNEEIRKKILKGLMKSVENLNPPDKSYVGSTNYLGLLMMRTFALMDLFSKTRLTDAEQSMQIQKMMYDLGMENANFAELLKDKAAAKEFTAAIGHFVNAGVSFIQIGVTLKQRGSAKLDAEDETDFTKRTAEQDKLLKGKQGLRKELREAKNKVPVGHGSLAAAEAAKQKDIKEIKEKIGKVEEKKSAIRQEKDKRYHDIIQERDRTTETMFGAFKQLSDGATRFTTGLISLEEGKLEKVKGQNDALNQTFNKVDDDLRKDRDNLQSLLDKFVQGLSQTVSDTIRAHQLGGR